MSSPDFAKGSTAPPLPYDTTPTGLGLSPSYLAGGAVATATASGTVTSYRKTSAKTVNTTTSETDLLNGEVTIAANALGSTGRLRLYARGDWKQNSGAAADIPRLKLKLGGTTLVDIGPLGVNAAGNSASRYAWEVDCDIMNLAATNAQWAHLRAMFSYMGTATLGGAAPTTGEGAVTTLQVTNAPNTNFALAVAGNSGTVDTTAACALVLSVINASASASYEVVLKSALVVIE